MYEGEEGEGRKTWVFGAQCMAGASKRGFGGDALEPRGSETCDHPGQEHSVQLPKGLQQLLHPFPRAQGSPDHLYDQQ